MFERILCAIDGSKSAMRAVEFAVKLAKAHGSGLRFVTVTTVSRQSAAESPFWDSELFDAGETQIARELAEAMGAATAAGVSDVTAATVHGRDIAAAILGYSAEHGFDHIVMGSAGHSAFGRLLAGSVVGDVLNRPHPPVTVA